MNTAFNKAFVALWPRVRNTSCNVCGTRGECTIVALGPSPLCDECLACKDPS